MVHLKLLSNYRRTVIVTEQPNVSILIDSGAEVPVWRGSFKEISERYEGVYKLDNIVTYITGFGGSDLKKISPSEIVIVPNLPLCGRDLFLTDLPVAINDDMFGARRYKLVLPDCVFVNCGMYKYVDSDGCPKELTISSNNFGNWIGCKPAVKLDKVSGKRIMYCVTGRNSKTELPVPKEVLLQEIYDSIEI